MLLVGITLRISDVLYCAGKLLIAYARLEGVQARDLLSNCRYTEVLDPDTSKNCIPPLRPAGTISFVSSLI